MTQEEKAKAYDEALELMKDCIPDEDGLVHVRPEEIFYELKESEDERIRKWIKNELESKFVVDNIVNNVMADKALAWLERQCEKGINGNDREIPFSEQILANSAKTCKDEHKPAENKGMNLAEDEMTPFQKKVFCIIDTTVEEEHGLKQVCDELFALASNEIKQKPAWSEEDEAKIVKLKSFIAQCNGFNKENRNKAFDLIDSIKPRHTWKPSDEQIKALEFVIKSLDKMLPAIGYIDNVAKPRLEEVLEALKKLK